jgi:hypothetical protein
LLPCYCTGAVVLVDRIVQNCPQLLPCYCPGAVVLVDRIVHSCYLVTAGCSGVG